MDKLPNAQGYREDLRAYLAQEGFKFPKGTFNNISAPGCDPELSERYNGGPPIEGLLPNGRGRNKYRPIYNFSKGLNWARSLLKAPVTNNNL
jgi:hypothetical protein